ncbi:MAG: glycosyltransferase family 2 protein [Lachnospiraceae bacterium]|nr:glycosyltransferase family 2 protein [Lachnospiraceae bacterium]
MCGRKRKGNEQLMGKTRLPISVCIIAKNEETYIERCLEHLKPYGMEIVVVDTGSEDATKDIAKRYTDKVYDFGWVDDFSAARNYAASKASNNWILVLDCDEYLLQLNESALRICMQQHVKHTGVLKLRNLYTQPNGQKAYRVDGVPRFYNRNFFEYRFRIHEQITPKHQKDLTEVVLYTYELPMVVEHHGYDITPEEMKKKQERNLKLLEAGLGEMGCDDYLYFQIGQSNLILGNCEKAVEAFEKCFALQPDERKGYMKVARASYAKALERVG